MLIIVYISNTIVLFIKKQHREKSWGWKAVREKKPDNINTEKIKPENIF